MVRRPEGGNFGMFVGQEGASGKVRTTICHYEGLFTCVGIAVGTNWPQPEGKYRLGKPKGWEL